MFNAIGNYLKPDHRKVQVPQEKTPFKKYVRFWNSKWVQPQLRNVERKDRFYSHLADAGAIPDTDTIKCLEHTDWVCALSELI